MGYLDAGEDLGKPKEFGDDPQDPDFILYPIWKYGRGKDDSVFIDVRRQTEPVVLLDGNDLHIQTVRGLGRLTTVDLTNGTVEVTELKPSVSAQVMVPSIHWYENDDELLLRDDCKDFNPQIEVPLEDVVSAVIQTFRNSLG